MLLPKIQFSTYFSTKLYLFIISLFAEEPTELLEQPHPYLLDSTKDKS